MAQLVECLPSVHEAWVSLAVVYKPETGVLGTQCSLNPREAESGGLS